MKSRIKNKLFTLCLIALYSLTLTVSAQTADSIKFSPPETKALLRSYVTEPKLIALNDSSESQIKELQAIIKNDSIENAAADTLIKVQNDLIGSYQDQSDYLKKQIKRETLWRRFWKTTTGVVIVIGSGYEIYKTVTP